MVEGPRVFKLADSNMWMKPAVDRVLVFAVEATRQPLSHPRGKIKLISQVGIKSPSMNCPKFIAAYSHITSMIWYKKLYPCMTPMVFESRILSRL